MQRNRFLLTVISNGVTLTTAFENEWTAKLAERRAIANGATFTEITGHSSTPQNVMRGNGLRAARQRGEI